jgi:hypothetical protein
MIEGQFLKNALFWDVTLCGFVLTDVSEERSASIIRLTTIRVLETLEVNSNRNISLQHSSVASYC